MQRSQTEKAEIQISLHAKAGHVCLLADLYKGIEKKFKEYPNYRYTDIKNCLIKIFIV